MNKIEFILNYLQFQLDSIKQGEINLTAKLQQNSNIITNSKIKGYKLDYNRFPQPLNLSHSSKHQQMKAICEKVNFRLKRNKTETEKAIYLNEQYSGNMRQLYQLLQEQGKLPKQKFLQILKLSLGRLQNNMREQLAIYKPYRNKDLQSFLAQQDIPNAYSLISICEDKCKIFVQLIENQIENLKTKLSSKHQVKQKQSSFSDKRQQIELLKKHLKEQKDRRGTYFNKIEKIKEQLQLETKNLIQNKITNFDQELEFRKLEKVNNPIQ